VLWLEAVVCPLTAEAESNSHEVGPVLVLRIADDAGELPIYVVEDDWCVQRKGAIGCDAGAREGDVFQIDNLARLPTTSIAAR
jgi:hypothetical protein